MKLEAFPPSSRVLRRIVFSKQADHDREMFPFWYTWYSRVFKADTIVLTPVKTDSSRVEATEAFYRPKAGVTVRQITMNTWNAAKVWREQLRIVSELDLQPPYLAVSADADQFYEFVSEPPVGADCCRFRQIYLGLDRAPTTDSIGSIEAVVSEEDEWAGFVDCLDSSGVGLCGHSMGRRTVPAEHIMFHCLLHGFDHFKSKVESLELGRTKKTSTHWRSWIEAYTRHGDDGLRTVYDDMLRRARQHPAPGSLLDRFTRPVLACAAEDRQVADDIGRLVGRSDFQMTREEYAHIADRVLATGGCKLLVFGLGLDSDLWLRCNQSGTTVFVEDQIKWIRRFAKAHPGIRVERIFPADRRTGWRTRLGRGAEANQLRLSPDIEETRWDVILVDGPSGYSDRCPGRLESIAFAAVHAHKHPGTEVLVHDCDRELEAACCLRFFDDGELHSVTGRLAHFVAAGS